VFKQSSAPHPKSVSSQSTISQTEMTKKATGAPSAPRVLMDLSPTEFEHLIFDLLIVRGMSNVVWRTPSADGGRDLEGENNQIDIAGAQSTKRWFVECKRYANSVDWPTVYEKVAYADSLRADVLLVCTTSTFSPQCLTHVSNWNDARRLPVIRLWPRHELEVRLQHHPDIALKYGLWDSPSLPGESMVSLSLAMSKSVSSHYSRLVFSEAAVDPMLEAAQALADLLLRRIEDLTQEKRIAPRGRADPLESVPNCTTIGDLSGVDSVGLRALVSYLYAISNSPLIVRATAQDSCEIESSFDLGEHFRRYYSRFVAIAVWSDFELTTQSFRILLRQRR
jgi:hypothetical protein